MKGWKFALAGVAALAALAAAAVTLAVWLGDRKLERTVVVRVVPVPFSSDANAVKAGRDLYDERCARCHAPDGAGRKILDDEGLLVRAPNVTRNAPAIAAYSEADWVRAIRHGVDPHGRALLFMPSEEFNRIGDADLAALVAYVRSLPPVDGEGATIRLPFRMKVMYGLGFMKDASEKIDHRRPSAP